MNVNQFTLKTQEVLQAAQQKAVDLGQQQVENAHLLHALPVSYTHLTLPTILRV